MAQSHRRDGGGGSAEDVNVALQTPSLPYEFLRSVAAHTSADRLSLVLNRRFNCVYAYDWALAYVRIRGGAMWRIGLSRRVSDGLMELPSGWKAFMEHYKIQQDFSLSVVYEGYDNFEIKVYDGDGERIMYYYHDFRCACYGPTVVIPRSSPEEAHGHRSNLSEVEGSTYERGEPSSAAANPVGALMAGGGIPPRQSAQAPFYQMDVDDSRLPPNPSWMYFYVAYHTSDRDVSSRFITSDEQRQRLLCIDSGRWIVNYSGRDFSVHVGRDSGGQPVFVTGWRTFLRQTGMHTGVVFHVVVRNRNVRRMVAVLSTQSLLEQVFVKVFLQDGILCFLNCLVDGLGNGFVSGLYPGSHYTFVSFNKTVACGRSKAPVSARLPLLRSGLF